MPSVKQPKQQWLLTEPELNSLNSLYDETKCNNQLKCNNPSCTLTSIRRHGNNNKATPPQPRFRCSTCTKMYQAFKMYQLLQQIHNLLGDNDTESSYNIDLNPSQSLEDFRKQIIQALKAQDDHITRHDNILTELKKLQDELTAAKEQITDLEAENQRLRHQLS
ncbi:hypothetical protein BDA99DRAFT_543304 [Phascolomyces articulosus]|uniref:Uncharacterized protein n=1 Tax=Phascolomyces articulosus TaxID=60185 RepID=A0AAD5P9P7_9FUNG|nr:hypothetical protein BDA99DRAFT_543304 [Phascolomyces articulosus]